MSDNSLPVLLNAGLDLVTPPLLAKQGALIDCLNYEMTSLVGYRRIDGYERYDGWTDGGVASFFVVSLVADVPVDQAQLVQGSLLGRLNSLNSSVQYIGVVVGVNGTSISYVPFRRTDTYNLNERAYVLTPSGNSYFFTATSNSQQGIDTVTSAIEYTQRLRDYSAQLRTNVQPAPSAIAGASYSRDRLYMVVDAPMATVVTGAAFTPPSGSLVNWKGHRWQIISYKQTATTPIPVYKVGLLPLAGSVGVSDDFVVVDNAGSTLSNFGSQSTAAATDDSEYGYMVYAKNPNIALTRGYVPLSPAVSFTFDSGSAPLSGPVLDQDYWAVNGGNVIRVRLNNVVGVADTSWTDGDKEGRAQVSVVEQVSGNRVTLAAGDVLHNAYPTTGTSDVLTLTSAGQLAVLAGTGALRAANTRYQFGTYNFYANNAYRELYGCNGVYRAFWANQTSYGSIYTQEDAALDNPKYLSMHARANLVLGFAEGSVQVSASGLPYNFSGVDGAVELGTGDDVTGLLEAVGDSTLIFGRRSISRLTGYSVTDYANKTVVAGAGAYDYTAVNVGTTPVFTDPSGISTLDQSSAYGDFVGQRATYPISTWLTPKLVPSQDSVEIGGVACAMPVREKMQYRLFLNSGEVVSLCFSGEGPKSMISDYAVQESLARSVRVPIAWSSEVADTGKEQLFVVWDRAISEQGQNGIVGTIPNPRQAYKLDYGWGFDGKTFTHYYDLAHTFVDNGGNFFQIDQVRLYGQGYGVASLYLRNSAIEDDFDMEYSVKKQDISMPPTQKYFYDSMKNVTSIIDNASWGLGIKIRIANSNEQNLNVTEPSHICQVLVMYMNTNGVGDR